MSVGQELDQELASIRARLDTHHDWIVALEDAASGTQPEPTPEPVPEPEPTPEPTPTPTGLLQPEALVYKGAFRLPAGTALSKAGAGVKSIGPNSTLLVTGHPDYRHLYSIDRPDPVMATTLAALPTATKIAGPVQDTANLSTIGTTTGSAGAAGAAGLNAVVWDGGDAILCAGSRYYVSSGPENRPAWWVRPVDLNAASEAGQYALWREDLDTWPGYHGPVRRPDPSDPNKTIVVSNEDPDGDWIRWHANKGNGFAFWVPPERDEVFGEFASGHTNNGNTSNYWSSSGPCIFTWDAGPGQAWATKRLLVHPESHRWGATSDRYAGGFWFRDDTREAVCLVAQLGTPENEYYGLPKPGACGTSKGYHADPYRAAVLFYDPNAFIDGLDGHPLPWQITPYAILELTDFWAVHCLQKPTGCAYDPATKRLWITQFAVDGSPYGESVVHVYDVE